MTNEASRQNVFRINRMQVKENERKGPKLEKPPTVQPEPNGRKEGWNPH